MSIEIKHRPCTRYNHPFFKININLNESVKSYLDKGEKLTNKKSIEILKSIKWKSSLKSFLTKPIVIIPMGIAISAVGIALAGAFPPIFPLALLVATVGGAILGTSVGAYWKGDLQEISKAFSQESKYAEELLEKLVKDKNLELKLNPRLLI
ncbi:MAG: hypothetical protein AAGG81_06105 [Chlamydiota bacterium]